MRLPPAIVSWTEEVLREVLRFAAPADGTLSHFFRTHPKIGSRERGVIAEAVYTVLRNKSVFTNFSESGTGSAMRRLGLLGLSEVAGIDAIAGLSDEEKHWLMRFSKIDRSNLPLPLRTNFPQWLLDKLIARYGEEETIRIADGMNRPAPLDLRVNVMKSSRDDALAALGQASIACEPTPYGPLGIRLMKKPALQNISLFKDGAIEVQDEGSQLLAELLAAKRGEMVVDFCAGAGGKTLALGASMRNTGRLYAFDVAEKRLSKLKPRLARSGLSNVHPVLIAHENDTKVKRLAGKVDRVLVDAPCSGLGTLRRNPDMKWRQTQQSVAELNAKQRGILAGAARLVKPGGRIVYATCSILDEENEAIVAEFLSTHQDFKLVPVSEVLASRKISLQAGEYLRLFPHVHQTDGFFAAVLERNG
jgi:16S rRNA (cytosine967-C5)-methyltransferase